MAFPKKTKANQVTNLSMTKLLEANIQFGLNSEEALLTWATKRLSNYEDAVKNISEVEKYYDANHVINYQVLIEDVKSALAKTQGQ